MWYALRRLFLLYPELANRITFIFMTALIISMGIGLGYVSHKNHKWPFNLERPSGPSQMRSLSKIHLDNGKRLKQEGRCNEAIKEFKRAVEVDPYNKTAYRTLSDTYKSLHQIEKSKQVEDEIERRWPHSTRPN